MQVLQQVMLAQQPWYTPSHYDKSTTDMNHIPATIEVSSNLTLTLALTPTPTPTSNPTPNPNPNPKPHP